MFQKLFTTAFALALSIMATTESSTAAADDLRARSVQAIDRGLSFLAKMQREDGGWGEADLKLPGLTAFPLLAFQAVPKESTFKPDPISLAKGYDYIRGKAQPDGGIYHEDLANYNTAVSLLVLNGARNPRDEPLLRAAHRYLVGLQATNRAKPELNGGIPYGSSHEEKWWVDLDNTMANLEALRAYEKSRPTQELQPGQKLDWDSAIAFINRCQNLAASNKESWVTDDPINKGGFIYAPGISTAGEIEIGPNRNALRSYGSMTYAGMLSLSYAQVDAGDPRVKAAVEWVGRNYTLEENPGMGKSGLFFYYRLMSKALATAGVKELTLADGRKVNWARELTEKIISLQDTEGFWINRDSGRWMEKDRTLVTSYCVLALVNLFDQLQ